MIDVLKQLMERIHLASLFCRNLSQKASNLTLAHQKNMTDKYDREKNMNR